MSDSDRAVWVCERLDEQWGKLTWHSHGEPLDALVQIILSQHTSDVLSDRAFDALRRRFPGGWDEVRMAPVEDIRGAISCGGLAEVKAPRIKAILQSLFDATGETDLGFLRAMPTPEIQAFLLSFHGVGPKTAACVLMVLAGPPGSSRRYARLPGLAPDRSHQPEDRRGQSARRPPGAAPRRPHLRVPRPSHPPRTARLHGARAPVRGVRPTGAMRLLS